VLRWRLLVAALIIAPLLGLLLADYHLNFGAPGIWLSLLPPLLAAAAAAELLALMRAKHLQPAGWAVHAGTQLVVLAGQIPLFWNLLGGPYPAADALGPLGWPLAALLISVAMVFAAEMARFHQPGHAAVNVALGVLIVVYVAVPMNFLVALRLYHDNRWGMIALVSMAVVVKMSDTGAYFFGRWCGRHAMAPVISPKKTIEGGVAGLVTAALVAWLFFDALAPLIFGPLVPKATVAGMLLFGVSVGIAGMLGDLAESLLKRDLQCKDSSHWMPGLGGVLDVLDSVLLAAPVAYLCWALGLVGP
jgi:phosphatidate cytidylyltransferase